MVPLEPAVAGRIRRYPEFQGAGVVVTGGASGIGAQIVRDFAFEGAKVAFLDIDDAAGVALADTIAKEGGQALFQLCNVMDVAALQEAIGRAAAWCEGLTTLINNVARDDRHAFAELTANQWDDNLAVNLRPAFFAAQAAAPHLRGTGGAIVNLGSTSWRLANADYPAYATSKSAMVGLTRSLARELGGDAVRVNCVTPGWAMTERQKQLWATPEALTSNRTRQCIKRDLTPHDVSQVVLFLASNAASGCTAQDFVVDLGQT